MTEQKGITPTKRPDLVWLLVIACSGVLAACGHSDATSTGESSRVEANGTAPVKKDRMALRRIERNPPACGADADCPAGSHCDPATSVCRWECIADSDCGPGAQCTATGSCIAAATRRAAAGVTANSANDSSACQLLSIDERVRVLSTLGDDQVSCPNGDDSCPCGAYCNGLTGLCEADCIAGVDPLPDSIPGCGTSQQCTPLGRCEASSSTPPPPVQALTLQIAPQVISGNTIAAPAVVPVAVSVTANSLDFIQPGHAATVRYRFATVAGQPPPPPGTMPQIKCTADGTPTDHCDLASWAFHVDTGSLVSDPQTIWVQLPQTATATQWMMEGRSDYALTPATAVVSAEPVAFPATDPGHYAGTMTWTNNGSATAGPLTVPVEAFVTSGNVALYEQSRILLPDGHAVFSRDATKVTMVGWLGSGTARYDVKLAITLGAYNSATGHLDATGSYQTGSLRQTPIALSLQRAGEVGAASCTTSASCATGNYCDAVMSLCLPGTGPAAGAGIVTGTAATPTTTLASSLITAWNAPLTTVLSNNAALLVGPNPREQFERPYCFQSTAQGGPAMFARGSTLLAPSNDMGCNIGGGEQAQVTFPFENRQQELGQDTNGNAFNLTTDCATELDAAPASSVPGLARCASMPRFLLALRPAQTSEFGYRLKAQLLRQWLGVNAYVANTTVQNQLYEDALGVSGQPPATRLAVALDRMDKDLAVLLDPSARTYYAPDGGIATKLAAAPDYRFAMRPVYRWTFNTNISVFPTFWVETPNVEAASGIPTIFCSGGSATNLRFEVLGSDTSCSSGTLTNLVNGDPAHESFSVVAAFDIDAHESNPGGGSAFGTGLITKAFASGSQGEWMMHGNYDSTNKTLAIQILNIFQDGTHGKEVDFPILHKGAGTSGFGLVAVVETAGVYRLMQALPGQAVKTFTPSFIGSGGVPKFGTDGQFDDSYFAEKMDEVSFWNIPLTDNDFAELVGRYNYTFGNEILPPRPFTPLPGDQTVGLPVHVLEAATADVNLLAAYAEADRNLIYSQCLAGQRTELDTVFGRVGRGLRTVAILEDEAASMATAAGTSTPWFARYQADQTELAGLRARLVATVASFETTECKNPLGISEEDLPLYVGSAGSSSAERFFAGSRYLANAALGEISVAGGETGLDGLLAQARSAYNAARISQFQEAQGAHDSADRILKISTDYNDQLKRYCGTPPGEDVAHGVFPLLAGFHNGTFTASNCFLKQELPECSGLDGTALSQVPANCLRGEIGERLLAIQAAAVDASNANNAYNRAFDQFESDMQYCGRLQEDLAGNEALLSAHLAHMAELRRDRSNWGIAFGIVNGIRGAVVAVASGGKAPGGGGIQDAAALFEAFKERDLDEGIQAEQDAYDQEKQARLDRQEVQACVQKADDEKFAIDAARDTIRRAAEQTQAALFALADDRNTVVGVASEGAGQLAIEATIDRTPPHLHYWLDQSISAYHAHLAYARRLTYLAVRAYEYEAQQTSGLRSNVLSALLPNDLKTVASTILGATAPFAGRSIQGGPLVLSLRDDILQIADLSQNSSRLDGTAPLTPTEAFRQLLKSDASRIYDLNGRYVGHGIKFSLRPESPDALSCAERLSRIMPSVTIENASQEITHTQLELLATNTFGSQVCGAAPGTLQLARIAPSQALLVGDALPTFPSPSAFSKTGLFPLLNTARDTLRNMTFPSDDPSSFAGRGRYGDYILIFPDDTRPCTPSLCDGWSTDALDKVDDVLLRFDLVEQDNTQL